MRKGKKIAVAKKAISGLFDSGNGYGNVAGRADSKMLWQQTIHLM